MLNLLYAFYRSGGTKLTRFGPILALIASCLQAAPLPPGTAVPIPTTATEIAKEQVGTLEAELGMLLQRRPDAAGAELAMIDYQVDLRVLERWMLSKAAEGEPESPLPACVALRVLTLQSTGNQILQRLQTSGRALTATQLENLKKLHDLTYALPEIKSVGVIDEICRTLTPMLILVSNVTPDEVKNLPPMRPQPLADASAHAAGAAPRSLADLTQRAQGVDVSAALKRQLIALAAAASLAKDGKQPEEASLLYEMLATAIDLSDGLEHNTGIVAAARPKLEQQLTEGLALFTDVRTRAAGKARIASLSQYRDTYARIQQLHLPPGLQQKLSPAFVWVNANPDSGAKVLEAIDKYLQVCARMDAPRPPIGLPPNQKKTDDLFQKQLAAQRSAFLDDAAGLGVAGAFSPGPAGLVNHVEQMRLLLDYIELVERLPRALHVLLAYKLRPTGGLEKRTNAAIVDLGAIGPNSNHDASAKLLADVEKLAQLSDTLNAPAGLSPEVLKLYTRGRMEAVNAKRLSLIGNLASLLAGGKDLDPSDLSKLETLGQLFASLKTAAEVETALAKADSLSRWVDWSISPAQLKALVTPYRDATAAAFEGFADDNATPVSRWPDIRKRFAPILELVREVGLYADQCANLPKGLTGEFAKLLTPLENQPFATERSASLAVSVWQHSAEIADPKTAEELFSAMLNRFRKELHLAD